MARVGWRSVQAGLQKVMGINMRNAEEQTPPSPTPHPNEVTIKREHFLYRLQGGDGRAGP